MFRRAALFTVASLTFALGASACSVSAGDVAEEGLGATDATEDELREGSCIPGDRIMPNLYDMADVPEFTEAAHASFMYSESSRIIANTSPTPETLGCETLKSESLRRQCRYTGFTAKDTSWGPRDEATGRVLVTVSNGGGGFQLVEPKDFYYCSANAARGLPPRIVLKRQVHVAVSPEGFDRNMSDAQADAALGAYCKQGTFDRQAMKCVLREGVKVDVSSYIKTPVVGEACVVREGTPEGATSCHGDLTCENGKWTSKSCATRASSSRSFCARQGYCKSSMSFPAEDAPCGSAPGGATACGKVLTAGPSIELTCQDGFWTNQSCASLARSSRSYCSAEGVCDAMGH